MKLAAKNDSDLLIPVKEQHFEQLQKIIEDRLPASANLYNTLILVRNQVSFPIAMYTYQGEMSDNSLIVFVIQRPDFGQDINISMPKNLVLTEEIKSTFASSAAIDWDRKYMFTGVAVEIGTMLADISARIKGNSTIVNPNFFYTMSNNEASKLHVIVPDGLELRSLNSDVGVNFLAGNWKYKLDGCTEYTKDVVQKSESSGVFNGETCVSGIMLNYNGYLGMLYTAENYRGKGLAHLCCQSLLKNISAQGMVPASCVEIKNTSSNKFHQKIGMKVSHKCVFVMNYGTKW